MKRRILATLVAAMAFVGLAGSAPALAWTQNYQSRYCEPRGEGNDRGLTWLKVTAWNINSTQRRYHVAVREDGGFHGTGFHTIRGRKHGTYSTTIWRGSSPSDNNPVEFYRTETGQYQRDVFANWTDYLGGLPTGSIDCAVTL